MEFSKVQGINDTFTTIASGAVIVEDGKVLLSLDNKDDFWKFPGGRVNDEESLRETAIRELKEETSLIATISAETKPIIYAFHKEEGGMFKYYVLVHYLCYEYTGTISTKNPHIIDARFFDLDELPNKLAPNVKPVIEKAKRELSQMPLEIGTLS